MVSAGVSRAEIFVNTHDVLGGISTVRGGMSTGCYAGLNLGLNTGDVPGIVAENRRQFFGDIMPSAAVCYLNQTHSPIVIDAGSESFVNGTEGDAIFTFERRKLLSIMVADCGNILLYQPGLCCAAIHAGWRGAKDGIIGQTVGHLVQRGASAEKLQAFIGPMIREQSYEVGSEFADIFPLQYLRPDAGRFRLNLPLYITDELKSCGIAAVTDCGEDTYSSPGKYYSYRRSSNTGRMSAFIVLR